MKEILILILFALLFSESCKKEEPELKLPPYTHDGGNVFACKINGNIFIAKGKLDAFGTNGGTKYYNFYDSLTTIYAQESKPFDADIDVTFIHTKGKTIFKLLNQERNSGYVRTPVANRQLAQTEYNTTKENTGIVNLTYYQNNIIAGTFEFDAVSDYGDTVHVTDGRFDISTQ